MNPFRHVPKRLGACYYRRPRVQLVCVVGIGFVAAWYFFTGCLGFYFRETPGNAWRRLTGEPGVVYFTDENVAGFSLQIAYSTAAVLFGSGLAVLTFMAMRQLHASRMATRESASSS